MKVKTTSLLCLWLFFLSNLTGTSVVMVAAAAAFAPAGVVGFADLSNRAYKSTLTHQGPIRHSFLPQSIPTSRSAIQNMRSTKTIITNTALSATRADGTDRGMVILGFVLSVAIWLFSIPPEFRRAHICGTDGCVANRAACSDCVTLTEWTDGVKDYYAKGGGISFDFTVAEETKEFWSGKR